MTPQQKINNFINIPAEQLREASWNYKINNSVKEKKLKANINRIGQVENLLVRELENSIYEVINGNHRLKILKELNYKEIICYNFGKITLEQAKRIAIETNELKFEVDNVKLSSILSDILTTTDCMSLATTTSFTEKEIDALTQDLTAASFLSSEIPSELTADILMAEEQKNQEQDSEKLISLTSLFNSLGLTKVPQQTAKNITKLFHTLAENNLYNEGEGYKIFNDLYYLYFKEIVE